MNFSSFLCSNFEALDKIDITSTNKIIITIEGPTCCGKTTFASNMLGLLQQAGLSATLICEAATAIFEKNNSLLKELVHSPNSDSWKKAKLQVQMQILDSQVKSLINFASSSHKIAIMDRSGASTAYHTVPYLKADDRTILESICQKITKFSKGVVMLSSLRFFESSSFRYQKTFDDISSEETGIRYYLDNWGINYVLLSCTDERIRVAKGTDYLNEILKV